MSIRGVGRPLLLLTGIGASLGLSAPFEDALNPLGVQTIAVDAPGTGKATRYRLPRRMPGIARTFELLLDALEYHRVDVLGGSFGGTLAQQLAHQAPSRVRRLVLTATGAGVAGLGGAGSPRALLALATPRRYQSPDYFRRIAGAVYGGEARSDPSCVAARLARAVLRGTVYARLYRPALRDQLRDRAPSAHSARDVDPRMHARDHAGSYQRRLK